MADRRMFSKKITNSARFLKMPLESQALYFHLAQNADDDGVVEGFTVMRLVGSSEDSLKLLVTKNYVKVLNEDLVVFVIDWLEHNKIRADRKSTTIYKDLLMQEIPEVKLIEPKERSDRKKKDDNGTSQGQPKDGLGEVRVGKDRIGKDIYKHIIEFLNLKTGKAYKPSSNKTKSCIDARLNEGFTEEDFKKVIDVKTNEWKGSDMEKFLRPETLFSNKFEGYLNQYVAPKEKPVPKSKEEILGVDAEIEEYYKTLGG